MRTFKFNVLMIVAGLVIAAALVAQANFFGKRVITRCFYGVTLKKCDNTTVTLSNQTCQVAKELVVQYPYVASASVNQSFLNENECPGDEKFCCVKVTEMLSTEPNFHCAPSIDLGEGLRRYKVASSNDVFCKFEQ